MYGVPRLSVGWARSICLQAPPHNSAARQAMSFPPSAACKFLDLPPVNLRNLHLHLTKNPFAGRPPHLCGVALNLVYVIFVKGASADGGEERALYKIWLVGFYKESPAQPWRRRAGDDLHGMDRRWDG